MAYNNYSQFAQPGQPAMTGYTPPVYQQPNQSTLVWVQGESGAKAYPVTPGNSVLLLDSESDRFFIKSSDTSGMPLPLRVFNYEEQTENKGTTSSIQHSFDPNNFVTRDEFNILAEKIEELSRKPKNEYQRKEKQTNGKPLIH